MAFAHLHVHTEHSLLDGMIRIDRMFEHVAGMGQTAAAITDHGTLSGIWKAQRQADRHGVKLIVGNEMYLAIGDRHTTSDEDADTPARRGFIEIERDDVSGDEGDASTTATAAASPLGELAATITGTTGDRLAATTRLASRLLEEWGRAARRTRKPLATAILTGLDAPNDRLKADPDLLQHARTAIRHAAEHVPAPDRALKLAEQLDRDAIHLAHHAHDRLGPELTERLAHALRPMKRRHHEHITLLAMNRTGWANLLALQNAAEHPASRHQGKPRIDRDLMRHHSDGLIALTGCLGGPLLGPLSRGQHQQAADALDELIDIFGTDRVYVEIMEHGIPAETRIVPDAVALAADRGVRIVATNDAHHLTAEQAPAHAAWLAHQSKSTVANPKYAFNGHGFHLATEQEMRAKRPEPWWQTACDETTRIADRIEPRVLPEPAIRLPEFPTPPGFADNHAYLDHLVAEGLAARYGTPLPAQVVERRDSELQVIRQMGMNDYFLIVHDMIAWARSRDILVGPGRGSAAGSLVSFALGIHTVDPLKHGLLFERFLEPGRAGMPDIDTDFEAVRRGEVFDYLADKYGHDRVARIGAFGFARSKEALKNAGRVLELTPAANALAKEVPTSGPATRLPVLLDGTTPDGEPFRNALATGGDDARQVASLAREFEDIVTKLGIHACGFLITDQPIAELVPLRYDPKATAADSGGAARYTAWDGDDVDDLGLCKIDILGIESLDVARAAIDYTGVPDLTLGTIPDPDTTGDPRVDAAWRLLRDGKTEGLFQIESDGMTRLVKDVQPESWADLSALLALYRPGPMAVGLHERFGARKHGREPISYDDLTRDPREREAIASVLADTQGLLIYQEQAMILSRVIAGFDAGQRSRLRKAMGKKNAEVMAAIEADFIGNAPREIRDPATGEVVSPVFDRGTAERVWAMIRENAAYAFNRSHSQAYARLTFDTAYLKANWPAAFGAGILATRTKDDKRLAAIHALAREGIDVLPPDVNRSRARTAPEGERAVRIGLGEVKGVGAADAAALVRSRDERHGGRFTQFWQPVAATTLDGDPAGPKLEIGTVEALIGAGAFDEFGPRLGLMMVARSQALDTPTVVPGAEWGGLELSSRQRAGVLTAFGDHPMRRYRDVVDEWMPEGVRNPILMRTAMCRVETLADHQQHSHVRVIGLLAGWAERTYSRGKLANLTLEGESGATLSSVMWDEARERQMLSGGIPPIGAIVAVYGQVRSRTIELEKVGEDGEVSTERRTELELVAESIEQVPVPDDARRGLPPASGRMPVFGAALEPDQPVLVEAPAPEPDEPAPAPAPAGAGAGAAVRRSTGREPDDREGDSLDAADAVVTAPTAPASVPAIGSLRLTLTQIRARNHPDHPIRHVNDAYAKQQLARHRRRHHHDDLAGRPIPPLTFTCPAKTLTVTIEFSAHTPSRDTWKEPA